MANAERGMTMTEKEIAVKLKQFIKAHKPDEFKTLMTARIQMWDYAKSDVPVSKRKVASYTKYVTEIQLYKWWFNGAKPWTEKAILDSLDTGKVTHKWIGWSSEVGKLGGCPSEEVIERLADWSFKYNIVGVEQKPGDLRIWIKESEDHQTNITGEVVEKIAKCLEF